jgi:hypothetical protein
MSTRRRKHLTTILVGALPLTVPPVFALAPHQLVDNVAAWIGLLSPRDYITAAVALVLLLVALLGMRLLIMKVRAGSRVEYLGPRVRNGMPEHVPRDIEERVVRILDGLREPNGSGSHEIRLVVVTGQDTLGSFEHIGRMYSTYRRWAVRVLILDPDAPGVDLLARGTRAHIMASLSLLGAMRETAVTDQRPLKLEWRTYQQLPAMRGYLIDDEHLFFGLTAWTGFDLTPKIDTPRMHTHDKRLAYVTPRDQFGRDAIESFKSWFDYQWKYTTRGLEGDRVAPC